jgi:hypothetical protein
MAEAVERLFVAMAVSDDACELLSISAKKSELVRPIPQLTYEFARHRSPPLTDNRCAGCHQQSIPIVAGPVQRP